MIREFGNGQKGFEGEVLFPPVLNGKNTNTQPFAPYYYNDIDKDGDLDFLQWNGADSIFLFLQHNKVLEATPFYIKLEQERKKIIRYKIDKKLSNWPFEYSVLKKSSNLEYELISLRYNY